jgi:hypothetical protein
MAASGFDSDGNYFVARFGALGSEEMLHELKWHYIVRSSIVPEEL